MEAEGQGGREAEEKEENTPVQFPVQAPEFIHGKEEKICTCRHEVRSGARRQYSSVCGFIHGEDPLC